MSFRQKITEAGQLVRKLFVGPQTTPPIDPRRDQDEPGQAITPAELLLRLKDDARDEPRRVRHVSSNAQNVEAISNAILHIMFELPPRSGGFTNDWLERIVNAFEQQPFVAQSSTVFYLYVATAFSPTFIKKLVATLENNLIEIARKSDKLKHYIGERKAAIDSIGSQTADPFDLNNPAHKKRIRAYLPFYLSVCPKGFDNFTDQAIIVGRAPLHDDLEIRLYQQNAEIQPAPPAMLALTVAVAGQHHQARFRLNAHRFALRDDPRPQPESLLYLGNWQQDWTLSIGAAEHDEIQCLGLRTYKSCLQLTGLMISNGRWQYDKLPFCQPKCLALNDGVRTSPTSSNEITATLSVIPKGSVSLPLQDFIKVKRFSQEIELKARALPQREGQVADLRQEADRNRNLLLVLESLQPVSAIKLAANFWLVRCEDGRVMRLVEPVERGSWQVLNTSDEEKFEVEARLEDESIKENVSLRCHWTRDTEPQITRLFCGLLYLSLPDNKARDFCISLSADEAAEGVLLSFGGYFLARVNPDSTLGRNGVVSVKCVAVASDGRGTYALRPTPQTTNPFFAFQPAVSNPKWDSYGHDWLVYGGAEGESQLQKDAHDFASRNGDRIQAEEYSYNLICGTSYFRLNISGTPRIGAPLTQEPRPRPGPPEVTRLTPVTIVSPPASAADFDPTNESQIEGRLSQHERWTDYRLSKIGKSNYAAHCRLRRDDGGEIFLKAYFPNSTGSARRETDFYTTYASRAAEIFIQPPLDFLRLNEEAPPWGLVFPRLETFEEAYPNELVKLPEVVAIGYGFAQLLAAMAERQLINFDLDRSMICFARDTGRLAVVDFDNAYPQMIDRGAPGDLKEIVEAGQLPAKSLWLPLEARDFLAAPTLPRRIEAMMRIGAPYGVYLLASILLDLRAKRESSAQDGNRVVVPDAFPQSAEREGVSVAAARQLEKLLTSMLAPDMEQRPAPDAVVVQFGELLRLFAADNQMAAAAIARITGTQF